MKFEATTLNMLTWSDHYANDQLKAVTAATGLQGRPTLFSDNADAYLKIKQTGGQFDIVSGDALWVPKYNKAGLTESFDLSSLPVSKQLYPIARQFPFWKDGSNYMGYPFSWSTVQIYYNPKYVTTKPDSWHALLDTKYEGKISLENIPTDVMAHRRKRDRRQAAVQHDDGEISRAKTFLKPLKPNVLKLASQNNEVVRALADGSAWIGITNLGTDDRVKDAGGPTVTTAYPREGTIGFIDSEQIVRRLEEPRRVRQVRERDAAGAVDREELHHERAPAVQREGVQDPGQPGPRRPRAPAVLQPAGEGAQDDDQGPRR